MFIKVAECNLVDNVPIANQDLVLQINPKLPFETMISFIRHVFVPVTQMAVSVEDAKLAKQSSN